MILQDTSAKLKPKKCLCTILVTRARVCFISKGSNTQKIFRIKKTPE